MFNNTQKEKRFEVRRSEWTDAGVLKVVIDTKTNVQYLAKINGGLTVLVDRDGKPLLAE